MINMGKGLEALDRIIETFYDKESEDIQVVKKDLKALDILNQKMVDVLSLKVIIDGKLPLYLYNDKVYYHRKLTDEEYELLKEVFYGLC